MQVGCSLTSAVALWLLQKTPFQGLVHIHTASPCFLILFLVITWVMSASLTLPPCSSPCPQQMLPSKLHPPSRTKPSTSLHPTTQPAPCTAAYSTNPAATLCPITPWAGSDPEMQHPPHWAFYIPPPSSVYNFVTLELINNSPSHLSFTLMV